MPCTWWSSASVAFSGDQGAKPRTRVRTRCTPPSRCSAVGSGSAGRAVSLREPVSLPPLGCLLLIGFIVCTSAPDRRKWLPFSELGAVRLFLDRQLGGLADRGGHGDGG